MSKVYESKPDIVKVSVSYQVDGEDEGTVDRYIVGFTLTEVIEAVTLSLDGAEQVAKAPAKVRKPRRTKADIQAESADVVAESAPPHAPKAPVWA